MSEEREESSGERIEHETQATYVLEDGTRETITLEPLEDFAARINSLDISPSRVITTPLITAACSSTKKMDEEDAKRVEYAIFLGQTYFQRVPLNNDEYLSRSQPFSMELKMLQQIFDNTRTTLTISQTRVFGVEPELIRKLTSHLAHRRTQAKESLLLAGVEVPSLPEWGPYNNLEAFWRMNEFEICASCYRREVECFLAYLGKYHKFINPPTSRKASQKPKDDDKSLTSNEEVEAILNTSTPRRKGKARQEGEGYATPGRKSWRARIDDSLGVGIEREQIHQNSRKSRRTSTEFFTAGMGESDVLSNLFNNDPCRPTPASIPEENEESEDSEPAQRRPSVHLRTAGGDGPSDDDSSSDDSSSGGRKPGKRDLPPHQPSPKKPIKPILRAPSKPKALDEEIKFDTKLKRDAIPEWDGNADTVAHWILRVNELAKNSPTVYRQLGALVPQRLTGGA